MTARRLIRRPDNAARGSNPPRQCAASRPRLGPFPRWLVISGAALDGSHSRSRRVCAGRPGPRGAGGLEGRKLPRHNLCPPSPSGRGSAGRLPAAAALCLAGRAAAPLQAASLPAMSPTNDGAPPPSGTPGQALAPRGAPSLLPETPGRTSARSKAAEVTAKSAPPLPTARPPAGPCSSDRDPHAGGVSLPY